MIIAQLTMGQNWSGFLRWKALVVTDLFVVDSDGETSRIGCHTTFKLKRSWLKFGPN